MKPERLRVVSHSVVNEPGCPVWCGREHLGEGLDGGGFHHDGPVTAIPLNTPVVPGQAVDLFVNVSQHAQSDTPGEPSLVEVQDEHQTLFLLTPVECLALSRALLAAAAQIATEEDAPPARVAPLVRELEETLADWRSHG